MGSRVVTGLLPGCRLTAAREDRPGLLQAADRVAATQMIYHDRSAGCLWVERLDQARYWSQTQARSLAQQVVWDHIDLLTGRSRE